MSLYCRPKHADRWCLNVIIIVEDAALLGSLQNGFHVLQDPDQRAQRTAALQQRSTARTGFFIIPSLLYATLCVTSGREQI